MPYYLASNKNNTIYDFQEYYFPPQMLIFQLHKALSCRLHDSLELTQMGHWWVNVKSRDENCNFKGKKSWLKSKYLGINHLREIWSYKNFKLSGYQVKKIGCFQHLSIVLSFIFLNCFLFYIFKCHYASCYISIAS